MYTDWASMDNEVFWGTVLIIFYLMMGTLGWVVFSSLVRKGKKRGYLYLVFMLAVGGLSLNGVFNYPSISGLILGFLFFFILVIYFTRKFRKKRYSN